MYFTPFFDHYINKVSVIHLEAATRRSSSKYRLRPANLLKKRPWRPATLSKKEILEECNFFEKETLAQVFPCEFWEVFKNNYFHRTPLVAASDQR